MPYPRAIPQRSQGRVGLSCLFCFVFVSSFFPMHPAPYFPALKEQGPSDNYHGRPPPLVCFEGHMNKQPCRGLFMKADRFGTCVYDLDAWLPRPSPANPVLLFTSWVIYCHSPTCNKNFTTKKGTFWVRSLRGGHNLPGVLVNKTCQAVGAKHLRFQLDFLVRRVASRISSNPSNPSNLSVGNGETHTAQIFRDCSRCSPVKSMSKPA